MMNPGSVARNNSNGGILGLASIFPDGNATSFAILTCCLTRYGPSAISNVSPVHEYGWMLCQASCDLNHGSLVKIVHHLRTCAAAGPRLEEPPVGREIETGFPEVAEELAIWKILKPARGETVKWYQHDELFLFEECLARSNVDDAERP
jgi:hypothetical protein